MKLPDYENEYLKFKEQSSTPDTPSNGVIKIFAKDGIFYGVDDAGIAFKMVPMLTGAAPAAGNDNRGKLHFTEGGNGAADVLKMCVKKSDDTYAWLTIGLT